MIPDTFHGPILISFGLGILFYTVIYMLGNLLQRKELKALASESFTDLSTVAVYLLFAVFLFSFIHNVTPGMLGVDLSKIANPDETGFEINFDNFNTLNPVDNIQDLPLIYLGEAYLSVMYYQGEKLYRSMLLQVGYMSMMSSITIGSGGADTISPFKGFDPFLNFAPTMLTSASIMLMTFSAQFFLLRFFVHIVPTVLFPLGILFRVLHPTRSFGGGLLALSFTMYFIFPLILSYNFAIMVNILGVENLNLDSMIFNAPVCVEHEECNSGKCVGPDGGKKFCEPCILAGAIPEGADGSICCKEGVSKHSEDGAECELIVPDEIEDKSLDNYGKGGIMTAPKNVENTGLVTLYATLVFMIVLSVISTISTFAGMILGLFGVILGAVTVGLGNVSLISFIFHPIASFIALIIYNSKFFFLGFILPAVQFIIIIEFVRVLTGSMGESIDIMDMFKVI
jgi:hypothetical protein